MAEKIGDAYVDIEARDKAFNKKMTTIGKRFRAFGAKLGRLAKRAGIVLGAALAAGFTIAIKSAAEAEEVISKFGTVFENVAAKAEKSARRLADGYGLAITTSKELLSGTGDLLVGFGFSEKAALDLAVRVNKLAVDLASFTNFQGGARGASMALTKALLGETESAKALGIVIRQDSDEYKALVEEGMRLEGLTRLQAKAMAAMRIATDQSTKAIGDYARTSGSVANQARLFRERLKEVSISFGQIITAAIDLPALLKSLNTWLARVREKLEALRETNFVPTLRMNFRLALLVVKETFQKFAAIIWGHTKDVKERFVWLGKSIGVAMFNAVKAIQTVFINMKDNITAVFKAIWHKITHPQEKFQMPDLTPITKGIREGMVKLPQFRGEALRAMHERLAEIEGAAEERRREITRQFGRDIIEQERRRRERGAVRGRDPMAAARERKSYAGQFLGISEAIKHAQKLVSEKKDRTEELLGKIADNTEKSARHAGAEPEFA